MRRGTWLARWPALPKAATRSTIGTKARSSGSFKGDLRDSTRDPRAALRLAFALTGFIGIFGALARALLGLALLGWRQVDARAPRLGKSDGDGLLRRARAVLAVADFLDFFVHEFAGLRGRRL